MGGESFYSSDITSSDITRGFVWCTIAGLCTCVGGAGVFFPAIVQRSHKRVLSAALAFAAGMMLYVSLVDIHGKSAGAWEAHFEEKEGEDYEFIGEKAFNMTTLCLFGGMFLMFVLDQMVKKILSSSGEANVLEIMEDVMDMEKDENGVVLFTEGEKSALKQMGLTTALCIAMHNGPEGLLTFVGYVTDPAIGVPLAIGVGIHNIPEGLCVSMPIYFATGERWRGFLWTFLAALTEPLGALVGYVIIRQNLSEAAYGVLFGFVAGMMVYISIEELLPYACKYDPGNTVITWSAILGMFAIAASLMLFSV